MRDARRARPSDPGLDELLGGSRFVGLADGRRLHYRLLRAGPRRGGGPTGPPPLVVWISGMGASGLYWAPLHRRTGLGIGAAGSVIYDRAGLGLSDDDPGPRTLRRLASDLIALLDALGALGHERFVLVGHSWGGAVARAAAARVPERIDGVLLVDPSDEHLRETLRLPPRRPHAALLRAAKLLSSLATARAALGLPPAVARELRRQELTPRAGRAHVAELARFDDELDALLQAPPRLDGIAVALISGTAVPASRRARARREAMVAAHERAAAAHPGLRLVRAERSSHLVPLTEPELVLGELRRLLRLAG